MPATFSHSVPFLPVKDLKGAITYYTQQLGFSGEWLWEDTDGGCRRDGVSILFNHDPVFAERIQGLEIVVFVANVNEVYEEYRMKPEINIVTPLQDRPWGMRDFTVQEINGYLLRISTALEYLKEP